ncbi:MAG: hypothetical protein J6U92_02210, partial [Clostridia bacterium]|nr:hypothetical protein [Clostridia bacterium]
PLIYFTAISDLFEFDFRDFTKYSEICAYMYNATDKTKEVTIGLVTGICSNSSISTAQGQDFVLEPNAWTRIDYWLDFDLLNLFVDLKNIEGVYFEFENTGNLYVSEENVYYLDDLKLVACDEEQEINDLIYVDKGEVCSFEKDYQNFIATTELPADEPSCITVSVVNSNEYNLPESFENKALKCVSHSTTDTNQSASKIILPGKLLQKTEFSKVSIDDYKKTYFAFDVYTTDDLTGFTKQISPWFTKEGGAGNGSYIWPLMKLESGKYYGKDKNGNDIRVEYGEFDKYADFLKPERNTIKSYKISFYEMAYGSAGGKGIDFLNAPGKISLWIPAQQTGRDITFYFDNFRIETGEEVYVKETE